MLEQPTRPGAHGPLDLQRLLLSIPVTFLVASGVVMFVLYIFMDLTASLAYDGYSYRDQTISELSAIGAPTRAFWLSLSPVYGLLGFAFAFGVLRAAGSNRRVRAVGWLLLALAVVGLLWWIAPMHQREVLANDGGTWQDTMHLVVGGMSSVLFLAMMAVGAFAFGPRFRAYSLLSISTVLVFGFLLSLQAPDVADNASTPWLGIWERVSVEGSMLWEAVFAVVLLRSPRI